MHGFDVSTYTIHQLYQIIHWILLDTNFCFACIDTIDRDLKYL